MTTREQYETESKASGFSPLSDAQITQWAYAVRHYVPQSDEQSAIDLARHYRIAARRLDTLEAESRSPKSQSDYPNGRTLDCGCTVYQASHVMTTSRGAACQDCYDRMSE